MSAHPPPAGSRTAPTISAAIAITLPLWPIFGFLEANKFEDQVNVDAIVSTFGIYLILAAALFVLVSATIGMRLAARTLVVVSVFFTALHFYADYVALEFVARSPAFFFAFLIFALLVSGVVARVSRRDRVVHAVATFAAVASMTSAVPFLLDPGTIRLAPLRLDAANASPPDPPLVTGTTDRPDIYVFVFDAYLRSDLLLEFYGHDNAGFVEELESRDFIVPQTSWSNFNRTVYAVNALLNPSWMDLPPEQLLSRLGSSGAYMGHHLSEVQTQFEALGYDLSMMIHTGAAPLPACEPFCMGTEPKLSLLEVQYLNTLPVYDGLRLFFPEVIWDWVSTIPNDPLLIFENRPVDMPKPSFYFMHVLLPHPPYVRNADCSTRIEAEFDFEIRSYESMTNDDERDLYLGQLRCANLRMLEIANRIEATDPDAIIVFLSDHGWKLRLSGERVAHTETRRIESRLANFWAARLPEHCTGLIGDIVFLTDTFPIIETCLEGGEASPQTDRLYTTSRDEGITDVTDLLLGTAR